jgi:hypothetical protein
MTVFSFLNPWFWLGAMALAGPIWLHLRRRRDKHLVRFSAVQFLADQPPARRSPFRLRDSLLFAMRGLAVLLIVGAFSWPFLRKTPSRSSSRSTVYILDNSLSRQASGAFGRDKERIVNDLNAAGPSARIAVLELKDTPRLVAQFGEEPLSAIEKVRGLKPSFQRGSYLSAFREANSLLSDIGGMRQIVLLGDNQANQWQENVTTAAFLRDVQIETPKPQAHQLPNLWLSDGKAQRLLLGETSRVNFTMRLGHLGPAQSARVTLHASGRMVFERTIDLRGQPETLVIHGECDADPGSWLQAESIVEGTPDALEADNHLYYAVPPLEEGTVALLAQSPYLRAALSPEVMRGKWKRNLVDSRQLQAEADHAQRSDVLCVESAYLQDPAGRALVQKYLDAGRGVWLILDRLSPVIDGYLRQLGLEPEGVSEPGVNDPEHIEFAISNNSIFQPFQSPDFGDLTQVTVSRYANLRPTAARTLLFSESGRGLFFESARYPKRLYVCAFGMDRTQTSWPIQQTFVPFLDLVLQAARQRVEQRTSFEPGEAAVFEVPPGLTARTVSIQQDGRELGTSNVFGGVVRLCMPETPGSYTLTVNQSHEPWQWLSVNPSARESKLVYLDTPRPIHDWSVTPGTFAKSSDQVVSSDIGFSNILSQHIWWWMVLAGLSALAMETAWVSITERKV